MRTLRALFPNHTSDRHPRLEPGLDGLHLWREHLLLGSCKLGLVSPDDAPQNHVILNEVKDLYYALEPPRSPGTYPLFPRLVRTHPAAARVIRAAPKGLALVRAPLRYTQDHRLPTPGTEGRTRIVHILFGNRQVPRRRPLPCQLYPLPDRRRQHMRVVRRLDWHAQQRQAGGGKDPVDGDVTFLPVGALVAGVVELDAKQRAHGSRVAEQEIDVLLRDLVAVAHVCAVVAALRVKDVAERDLKQTVAHSPLAVQRTP
jgi:hypothetical protein